MSKLWQKDYDLDAEVEAFTVGEDHVLDAVLVEADCLGSVAHALTLVKAGVLKSAEAAKLRKALAAVVRDWRAGKFAIQRSDEDVHTAVENRVTAKLGILGKKMHTGRSRNDQVIVDLRIWGKSALLDLIAAASEAAAELLKLAERGKDWPLVGRTHTQRAMPSSVGLWAGAFAESLLDDVELLRGAYELIDRSPLGSAASYGVPLPLDRALTARLLGFREAHNNVLYANNARGKFEAICLAAAAQVMLDLSRLAQDLILWSLPEFGYFKLPRELCSGSSIMPQKRNPCGLELVRAKAASVYSQLFAALEISRALPSGYNRDNQETKGFFMRGLGTATASARIAALSVRRLEVDVKALKAAFHPEVYATDEALDLVLAGVPFRDAYKQVGLNLDKLSDRDPVDAIRRKKSLGATGNLNLGYGRKKLATAERLVAAERAKALAVRRKLLGR
ncbi:MAG TPA: argininosuccinate lyase [Planctomycetota bacterium]|nr:argininosuccinate lyase [Planctomycetota bacterium]